MCHRYDDQKQHVEDYQDWRNEMDDVKAMLENTKSEMDVCEQPTSDVGVREKQTTFLKVCFFFDRVFALATAVLNRSEQP